ncbi:hypothetical protein VC83_05939 [Pseudogymnoascus destructans]|uniref:Exosome non-catalytic core component n=1 Tax=Pseudogymnoascus destructans TaxID=655981 RepID=A0A177A4V1_9PEZI|nr:uncharacterized protein VC83_05939 [Pseudogymnoascus destructans]OAF57188.1 hypothetical protein VC83_05939 [Pseudogymnoascus destructans]
MPREPEPSLNERQFILQALEDNLRLDGRGFDDARDVEITFGDAYGSVDVQMGKTRVLATISCSLSPPSPPRPFDGIFTLTTEFSPMATPTVDPSRPSPPETLLARLLDKTLRRSAALDTESLCLLAGKSVWAICCDLHILSHGGGLLDACCVAALAGLLHFRRPEVSVEGEKVTIYSAEERAPVPLSLLHLPFCVTFSIFGIRSGEEEAVLLDADRAEEGVREGAVTVGVNRHGEVCQIAKLGGREVDALELLRCVGVAEGRAKVLDGIVRRRVGEEERRRDGGRGKVLSAENER